MAHIAEISEQSFENEVLNADLPVLMDFFAPWCGPCRTLAPVLDELAQDPIYQNKINFFKINIDNNLEIAKKYKVSTIPTLIIFEKGVQTKSMSGAKSKSELTKILREYI